MEIRLLAIATFRYHKYGLLKHLTRLYLNSNTKFNEIFFSLKVFFFKIILENEINIDYKKIEITRIDDFWFYLT